MLSPQKTRRCGLALEQLETRDLMAAPVLFSAISETIPGLGSFDLANSPAATGQILPTLQTSPMMESRVSGRLSTGADVDVVRVHLQKGQIFTADADFSPYITGRGVYGVSSRLSLFGSAGQPLVQGSADGISYRVTESGDYFVGMACTAKFGSTSSYGANYTMHIRPIGLAGNDLDPRWLQRSEGGIYVWQDGNLLNISGPVGHGFSIRADEWQQTIVTAADGSKTSTYRSWDWDGVLHVQTGIGVDIPVKMDEISITTRAGKFGDLYGELQSSSIRATSEVIQAVAGAFGDSTPFGMDLSADNMPFTLGEIGLRLGKDPLLQATGAPLHAAVPYLFINAGAGVNASSEGSFAGITYNLGSLIVDPADPFLYVATDYYGWGLGLSHQGLIPFTPEKAPSQFNGQLYGHVYVAGEFSLLEVTGLPLSISGNIVLNLNGHGTGQINGQTAAALGSVSSAMTSMNENAPPTDATTEDSGGGGSTSSGTSFWRNFSVGINANLNVILPLQDMVDDGLTQYPGTEWFSNHPKTSAATEYLWSWLPEDLSLSLATASVIYDGPNGGLFFRGGTNNWLEGTDLEFLSGTQVDIDGAWLEGGKFFLDAEGQYGAMGMPIQGRVILARDYDLAPEWAALIRGEPVTGVVNTTGGYLEVGTRVLGSSVTLKGRVQANGDFELVGNTGVNLGIANSSLTVKLQYSQAAGVSFTATLTGTINLADTVRAKVTVNFTLGVDSNGHIRYSGSGTAKMEVKTPHTSLSKGLYWTWDEVASATIGVNNDAFWFSALGYNVRINLPH